jgi:aminoglycoside phosphotransferase (APT) family kinase protein
MPDRRPAVLDVERPAEHPAALAWRRLAGSTKQPVAIRILKENWKTLAYRLVGCGPEGGDVVATRHPTPTTLVERLIYGDVLPQTSVPSLRLHGVLDEEDGTSWLFLDDAGEEGVDLRRHTDRTLAGTWLGRLHADLAGRARPDALPDRGADDALRALRSSRADLLAAIAGPSIDDDGRRFCADVVRRLDMVEGAWDAIADDVEGLPSTLVHADLVSKNLRIRQDQHGSRSIVAFDWEMCGWGIPLRDLAPIDVGAYTAVAGRSWGGRARDLGHLADLGRLFGLLAAIEWEMPGLQSEWPRRFLVRLRVFHERLGTAVVRAGLAPLNMPSRRSREGRVDVDLMDRRSLETGLRSMEPDGAVRIVDVLDRMPNVYRSTSPSEIVRCAFDDGVERSVVVKRHVPGLHAGGRFWEGGPYEADIYRDILAARDLGTPSFYGSWSDPSIGDTFLAIEHVEGWRLGRSDPSWLVEAARWLAHLHGDLTPIAIRRPGVRVYDAPYLCQWSLRAVASLRASGAETDWLEPLARMYDDVMVPKLAAAEATFVHGEPYPENLIVSGGRIRAVDWQSAAIACLTDGPWPSDLVAESEAAYIGMRWPHGAVDPRFGPELEAARLYWAMRWLGADADPTTSSQRATYVASLRRSAERLGLVAAAG